MKRIALYLGLATGLVASCSIQEENHETPQQDDVIFYASFEQPGEEGTKVYANEDLLLRWNSDDRVSIFNKITYNQEYRFTGQTGANAGGFKKVDNDEFVTGNAISHVVSVYPYQESTAISESEEISFTLPAEQHYAENTFGLSDNTMVSVSEDNVLQYKSVGGFLRISLYGEGVTVSSIALKGNIGEKLAGKATVTMPLDGTPTAVMSDDATDVVTLVCDTPVELGETAEESKDFWFVVPPVTFNKGFTITVSGYGGVFEKATEKTVTIERNKLSKMSPIEVELSQPKNVIYYTSLDGNVVTPYNPDAFGASILSNEYVDGRGVITFDGDVTSIGREAFSRCSQLKSIKIPDSVEYIGISSFSVCTSLTSITIPDSVTGITYSAFYGCINLTSITIPDSVAGIGDNAFQNCTSLTGITIPDSVTIIGDGVFAGCTSLMSFGGKYASSDGLFLIDSGSIIAAALGSFGGDVTIPDGVVSIGASVFSGFASLTSIKIPDSVTNIGDSAFGGCISLTSITIPDRVTSIGSRAFAECTSLTSITVLPSTPPLGGFYMLSGTNNAPIYVPTGSVDAYKAAEYWSDYADRIYAIGTPVAIDLGLPSGLKWASFNLGATRPEEYGDYYAWGETEPYYSSQDPLTWKEGKEAGYYWSSYKWCMGAYYTLTKYCTDSRYGYNGFTDGKTVLDPEDDAAHVNLGGKWRMPTDDEWTELRENCTWSWTTQNGVDGYLVTGPNGNSIFFPAAGNRNNTNLDDAGSNGNYWSSSLNTGFPSCAMGVGFRFGSVLRNLYDRSLGQSVRPVTE